MRNWFPYLRTYSITKCLKISTLVVAFKDVSAWIVFNLSKKVFSETEIKVQEKGVGFAPIHNKINDPELRKDFEEFCRRIRIKCHFCNVAKPQFSEIPAFTPSPHGSHLKVILT